jgi:hypothetical protein
MAMKTPSVTVIPAGTASPSRVASPNAIRAAKLPYGQDLAKDLEFLSKNINDLHGVLTTTANPGSATGASSGSWQNWTPTVGPDITGITVNSAMYLQVGRVLYFSFDVSVTVSVAGNTVTISGLPIAPVAATPYTACYGYDASGGNFLCGSVVNNGTIVFNLAAFANFAVGTFVLRCSGFYQC